MSHRSLDSDDEARLRRAREWVLGHFTDDAEAKYTPIEGKLRVIDAIITNEWVQPSQTWELQALGAAFGDALAQKLMLEWVTVEDEYGKDPALNWPGTSLLCYPLTMISKRKEAGEALDVHRLFEQTVEQLSEMAFSGRYK